MLMCDQVTMEDNQVKSLCEGANQVSEVVPNPNRTPVGFNHLATELRLMIWELVVSIPRIIRADTTAKSEVEEDGVCLTITIDGLVREQACPLLGVCRESRWCAMKGMILFSLDAREYDLCLEPKQDHFAIRQQDTVYWSDTAMGYENIVGTSEASKIRHVMFGSCAHTLDYSSQALFYKVLSQTWIDGIFLGYRLTRDLGSREGFKTVHLLVRAAQDKRSVGRAEMDDFIEFVPYKAEWDYSSTVTLHELLLQYSDRQVPVPHLLMRKEDLAPLLVAPNAQSEQLPEQKDEAEEDESGEDRVADPVASNAT
ncbi:hypothetical protein F4808DRAFT_425489 [Astrocystis sublimbata]|nr:hypothetical protein F4808DRAFT_425489 [Astrocystis sublimbata]